MSGYTIPAHAANRRYETDRADSGKRRWISMLVEVQAILDFGNLVHDEFHGACFVGSAFVARSRESFK